jgi:hypothetical protein
MKVKKTNQRIRKKNWGKGLKERKLQGLPLHWFFTNDSTIGHLQVRVEHFCVHNGVHFRIFHSALFIGQKYKFLYL